MTRTDAIRRCRALQQRFARMGERGWIGHEWAAEWAAALHDPRTPVGFYINWIEQQEARCDRIEAQTLEVLI